MIAVPSIAAAIEFIGALIIMTSVSHAFWLLMRSTSQARVREIIAEGAVTGLSFKLAATLLKTIELRSWNQILIFIAVLALRTLLKTEFKWQQRSLAGPRP